MGKHKPIFDPSTDCGDYVVVTGCNDVFVTGNKMTQKKYYSHSTRPGSLKEMTMDKMMAKWGGAEILKRAVRGMLPKNRLRDDRMARLKCKIGHYTPARVATGSLLMTFAGFEGQAHPYKQNLLKLDIPESITELPQIKETFQQAASTTPAS